MTLTPARIGEWITVGTALVLGGLWLGSLNTRVEAGEKQLAQVSEVAKTAPTDVAVLKNQMSNVEHSVEEIKAAQKQALDEQRVAQQQILDELRRR